MLGLATTAASTIISGGSVIKIQNNNYDVQFVFVHINEVGSRDIEIRYNRFVKRGPYVV